MKAIFHKCTPLLITLLFSLTFACTKYQIPDKQGTVPEPDPNISDPLAESTCDPDTVYFQNTILPLVVSSCGTTGCHDEASHRHGVILTNYNSIIKTGGIKSGDPNDSEFFETLTDDGDDLMPPPPFEPLNSEEIQLIRTWIEQGAENNICFDGCDTSAVSFAGQIWPMMESYCTGCHSASAPGGGIVIAGYTDMVALAENGSLMGSVRGESAYASMPPNQQLSDCNISLLQKWINEDFPE